jgi:hypothetical protein
MKTTIIVVLARCLVPYAQQFVHIRVAFAMSLMCGLALLQVRRNSPYRETPVRFSGRGLASMSSGFSAQRIVVV